jgi:hypothetical protein
MDVSLMTPNGARCCIYSLYFEVIKRWERLLSYVPAGICEDKQVVGWLAHIAQIEFGTVYFAHKLRNEIAHPKDIPVSVDRAEGALRIITRVERALGVTDHGSDGPR